MSEHTAGRELDALIAEKVMGGRWDRDALFSHVELETGWLLAQRNRERFGDDELHVYEDALPYYSTDISAAFAVVEKMREHREHQTLRLVAYPYNRTYATFIGLWDDDTLWSEGNGEHATPLAICLAALRAVSPPGQNTERTDTE